MKNSPTKTPAATKQVLRKLRTWEVGQEFIMALEGSLLEFSKKNLEAVFEKFALGEGVLTNSPTAEVFESKDTAEAFIKELRELPVLKLGIALEPPPPLIEVIHGWVVANVPGNIWLSFEYSPSVVAGATVSFGGKYLDISVRKSLETAVSKVKL